MDCLRADSASNHSCKALSNLLTTKLVLATTLHQRSWSGLEVYDAVLQQLGFSMLLSLPSDWKF